MPDIIKDVAIRIALQHVESKLKAPDIGPYVEAQNRRVQAHEKANERIVAADKKTKSILDMTEREMDQSIENRRAAMALKRIALTERLAAVERQKAEEAAKAQQAQADAMIRTTNAMKTLGENAMLTIRGFVMLGASGEKEVQKILNSLLMVQGAIDVYKGLTGTLSGVAQAYRAVKTASEAAAAAQLAHARAGNFGRAAFGSLTGGLFSGGIASGLATGGSAFALGGAAGFGLNRLSIPGFGLFGTGGMTIGRGLQEMGIGTDLGFDDARQTANLDFEDARDRADLARRDRSRRFQAGFEDRALRTQQAFAAADRTRSFRMSEAGVRFSEAGADVGRARTAAERLALQSIQNRAGDASRHELHTQGRAISGELGEAQNQRAAAMAELARIDKGGSREGFEQARLAAVRAQQDAEKNIADALQRQTANRQAQLSAQREAVQLAREHLQAEKDRVAGMNRGIGTLNPGELGEARRLARKVQQGGTLNEGELGFLEGRGGGAFSEFTQKQREQRGAAANVGLESITGPGSQVNRLQGELDKLVAGDNGRTKVAELLEAIDADMKAQVDAASKQADTQKEINRVQLLVLASMQDQLDTLQKINARRAAQR